MAFADATIRSGVEIMIEETQLAEKIAQADYTFTGEGGIDFQTKFGKTPFGVAQVAKRYNKTATTTSSTHSQRSCPHKDNRVSHT